jgi:hypothetical protein
VQELQLPLDGNATRNTGLFADALSQASALTSLILQVQLSLLLLIPSRCFFVRIWHNM